MIESTTPRRRTATRVSTFPRAQRVRRWNHPLDQMPCECGRPDCRETFPIGASVHRSALRDLLVSPSHYIFGQGTVVRAADEFFVVQAR
jgi:hypothetical protein